VAYKSLRDLVRKLVTVFFFALFFEKFRRGSTISLFDEAAPQPVHLHPFDDPAVMLRLQQCTRDENDIALLRKIYDRVPRDRAAGDLWMSSETAKKRLAIYENVFGLKNNFIRGTKTDLLFDYLLTGTFEVPDSKYGVRR
jgi:hypothetical protein